MCYHGEQGSGVGYLSMCVLVSASGSVCLQRDYIMEMSRFKLEGCIWKELEPFRAGFWKVRRHNHTCMAVLAPVCVW